MQRASCPDKNDADTGSSPSSQLCCQGKGLEGEAERSRVLFYCEIFFPVMNASDGIHPGTAVERKSRSQSGASLKAKINTHPWSSQDAQTL